MKTQPVFSLRVSFRQIIVAAAGLVAMLTGFNPISAQTSGSSALRNRTPLKVKRMALQKVESKQSVQGITSDHRPPITFDEGSLTIGALKIGTGATEMNCVESANTTLPRRYTCTRNSNPSRAPRALSISITKDDGDVDHHNKVIRNSNWEIRIWLEVEESDGVFVPVLPESPNEPQIILKSPYTLEADKPLFVTTNCTPTSVPERPCKYEHPGYPGTGGTARHYRIAQLKFAKGGATPSALFLHARRLRVSGSVIPEPHEEEK